MDANLAARQSEYQSLRMQALLDTVTAQRNDAQNQVVNLTADKTVISRALKDASDLNTQLGEKNASLLQQVEDLQAALQEAHEALRNQAPPTTDRESAD